MVNKKRTHWVKSADGVVHMVGVEDEVITKVRRDGITAETYGIVESICSEGVWVDVYIPADADVPADTVLYEKTSWNCNKHVMIAAKNGIMTLTKPTEGVVIHVPQSQS